MRVLFLTPWYPDENSPNHGIFIRNLAVALSEKHTIQVVCSKIDYSSFGFCSVKRTSDIYGQIQEHRLVIKRSLPIYNQLNYFLISTWFSWKIARQFDPDLIHGNISYPGGFWAWLISRLVKRPFILTEHTRIIHNFRSPIHRLLTVFSIRKSSAVQTVSTRMANEINSFTGKTCHVVPNIILTDEFKNLVPLTHGEVLQIGFLGGMNTHIKGLDILLKAMAPIKRTYRLHIAGAGKLSDQYKILAAELGISDRCIFYGFVPHWGVPEFMSRLNFLVSASRYESFGMAILEAIACGLPVVATRCGGPEDFITKECGILVPAEDIAKLREAIEWMMNHHHSFDPPQLKRYVSEQFSAGAIVEKMNAIYSSALGSKQERT